MSDPSQTQATGTRGGGARRVNDREERVTTLDPTPAMPQAIPGEMRSGPVGIAGAPGAHRLQNPSSEVVGDARRDAPSAEEAGEKPPVVQFFRYVGDKPRSFTMKQGDGRDGYTARMQPGKVISTKEYSLPQLKSQGFLPGRNLEEISEEEAKAG